MTAALFPFGVESSPRSARRSVGPAAAFVLGVYPSALHVRWTLPAWSTEMSRGVRALAVADEPTVFWDGAGADALVESWKLRSAFVEGDDPGQHGHVAAAGNGTSGRPVVDRVLSPLGIAADETWFTDAVDRFFVKRGSRARPEQGDVIDAVYTPFAHRVGLPAASLPTRPNPSDLIRLAVTEHRDRLLSDIAASETSVVVTLGEEARRVLADIADHAEGPPTVALESRTGQTDAYGEPGQIRVAGRSAAWFAVTHPGNRSQAWRELHDLWISRRRR